MAMENRSVQVVWLDESRTQKLKTPKQSHYVIENKGQFEKIVYLAEQTPTLGKP